MERNCFQQLLKEQQDKPKVQQQQELISHYESRQIALKLLANAGYGAFAKKEFAYSDYRVSEIITGFGRPIHKTMEQIGFQRYGFQTVFGFTDSIFIIPCCIASDINSNKQIAHFLTDCEHELYVNIEHKNRFMYTVIFDKTSI